MINLKEDYKDYLALVSILSFSLLGLIYFGHDRLAQTVIVVTAAVLYVLWGAIHHLLKDDFHFKVLAEYLALAIFAVVLILTLLGKA